MGFRVWGVGFGVWGLGLGVGFRVWGWGMGVGGWGFGEADPLFKKELVDVLLCVDLGWNLGFRIQGLGFSSGLGFGV